MDRSDPGFLGFSGRGGLEKIAPESHIAVVQRIKPGEDFKERGLTCAIFAHQSVDLSRTDAKVHVREGLNSGKRLAYLPHFEDAGICHILDCTPTKPTGNGGQQDPRKPPSF